MSTKNSKSQYCNTKYEYWPDKSIIKAVNQNGFLKNIIIPEKRNKNRNEY